MSDNSLPSEAPRLDDETERCISGVIGAMNWKRVHGKQLGDEVPEMVAALRARVAQLQQEAFTHGLRWMANRPTEADLEKAMQALARPECQEVLAGLGIAP